tara:strand:- start:5809 stop:6126 length:318 start_codon:yes stop_codon:yes gene_type:complete
MSALIGNIVIVLICIVIFQKITGASTNVSSKVRNTIKNIDDTLSQSEQKLNRNRNPQDFCNSAEFLLISSMISHPRASQIRDQFDITEAQAKRLSRKMLKEISYR